MGKIFVPGQTHPDETDGGDSVARAMLQSWNDQGTLEEMHRQYLEAIQHGASKSPWKKGESWGWSSSFKEWLFFSDQVLDERLEEIKSKLKTGLITVAQHASLITHPDFQPAPHVGKSLDKETAGFYTEVVRKSKEVIKKYFGGALRLNRIDLERRRQIIDELKLVSASEYEEDEED